jgi:DNA-binding CsgD family transcriptional regulator
MRRGMTNKQMAERLDISVNTIKKHLASVFEKRGLHGRRQEFD